MSGFYIPDRGPLDVYNKPWSSIHYLDKRTYEELKENNVDPLSFYDHQNNLSELTKGKMHILTRTCYEKLITHSAGLCKKSVLQEYCKLNEEEIEHILSDVEGYLRSNEDLEYLSIEDIGKCYEIVPHIHNGVTDLLVVVSEGFLNKVTRTKEDLLEYFLTVLRHGYESGLKIDETILLEYLRLKMSDNHFDLVQYRLN